MRNYLPSSALPPFSKRHSHRDGDQTLSINNTRLRRWLTLIALKSTARLYPRLGICVPISKHHIVKSDSFVDLTEAATMKFVADSTTSIPVPKVYCSFVHHRRAYIVMERIRGEAISKDWDMRSRQSKEKLVAQLKAMFGELRALEPPSPGAGVQSCTGGSPFDSRMPQSDSRFGPFPTIQDFHRWLRADLRPEEVQNHGEVNEEDWRDIKDMAAKQDGPWPPPVFSHADMNPSNILVSGDDIVGIVDWEFSGWYPHYWEYTSAWTNNPLATVWQEVLGEFIDVHRDELSMEMTRQKFWGGY